MKIYTKKGDLGLTSLYGRSKITKAAHELVVIGHIDKLNAMIGVTISQLETELKTRYLFFEVSGAGEESEAVISSLRQAQYELFCVGAELGTTYKFTKNGTNVFLQEDHILDLEKSIDEYTKDLPELTNFIMPGGLMASSNLHLCRAICRDTERELVHSYDFQVADPGDDDVVIRAILIKYFNRLSDWFFTVARFLNIITGSSENIWVAPGNL